MKIKTGDMFLETDQINGYFWLAIVIRTFKRKDEDRVTAITYNLNTNRVGSAGWLPAYEYDQDYKYTKIDLDKTQKQIISEGVERASDFLDDGIPGYENISYNQIQTIILKGD